MALVDSIPTWGQLSITVSPGQTFNLDQTEDLTNALADRRLETYNNFLNQEEKDLDSESEEIDKELQDKKKTEDEKLALEAKKKINQIRKEKTKELADKAKTVLIEAIKQPIQEYIDMGKSVYNFFRDALGRVESSTTTLMGSAAQGSTMLGALPPGTGTANVITINNQLIESKDSLTTTCDDAENKLNSVIKVLKIAMIDATGIGELIKTLDGIKNIVKSIRDAVDSIPTFTIPEEGEETN